MEIYGEGTAFVLGKVHPDSPYALKEWDYVLSKDGKIWGVATDDYTPNTGAGGINSFPGFGLDKGCIRILSDKTENSKAELMECLKEGRFYATQGSQGPKILKIEVDRNQIDSHTIRAVDSQIDSRIIRVVVDGQGPHNDIVKFIGKKKGKVETLQESSDLWGTTTAEYTCNGTEDYVRIEVTQGSLKSWSQPIFISKLPSSSTTSKSTRKRATEIIPSATLALCDATLTADASDGTKIDGYTIAPFECPASSSPSSGYIGHIYYFTADADDESLSDIGLTITYKDSDLYVNPNRLAIYQYDPVAESWAELPSTVDTASHTVTANPYSLGLFALSAIDEEDFVSPDVAFETAVDGAILYELTAIKVQASDYNSVSRVKFYLDGILLDTDNSAEDGWTTTLDPRLITAGTHTLTAEAIDDADNSNQAEITITIPEDVAAKPPVVTITSPSDGSKVSGQITLTGTVIAASTAYVVAVVDETPIGWAEIDEQGNWTITLDMTILDNGQHVISIIATDAMGAQTTTNINLDIENQYHTYYQDADGDGYGDPNRSITTYAVPIGYVEKANDCHDNDPNINPYAKEACDGLDNDCDGQIDEGVMNTYYRDVDGDGYGDASRSILTCSAPAGYVADNTDCNDTDRTVHPGAPEIPCNDKDDDCLGGDNVANCGPPGCNGDLNGDGNITPADAFTAFKCYLGSGQCSDCSDVNQDGSVTPADALCVFKKYLGQPSCLN